MNEKMVDGILNKGIVKEMKNLTWNVRKLYIDPAGGLIYSLGCSLVHLSLFIGSLTV